MKLLSSFRLAAAASLLLLALPAAKGNGCGPSIPIGGDDTLGKACGGNTGLTCNAGEGCVGEAGTCGGEGVCQALGGVCTLELAPVCGCDGNTYDNACEATASGVTIDYQGECGQPLGCGGIAGVTCAATEFCDYPDSSCGAADQTGTCEPRPDACPAVEDPVCGCDGNTYSNGCAANAAGVSVASDGPCAGQTCGGFAGTPCPTGTYCDFPDDSCGGADQTGVCTVLPEVCTEEANPVCGCDGMDYVNPCYAAAGGTDVASSGTCP